MYIKNITPTNIFYNFTNQFVIKRTYFGCAEIKKGIKLALPNEK